MMKTLRFIAAAFAAILVTSASAQIADGSEAPDFTTTDINGNTIVLADLLAEGKVVILDVSATWCGPCWNYHNTGILETFWELFGPNGANIAEVIMVEGDPSTTIEDIYGTGSATIGDWTEGVGYPITDDADIADAYQITYYPTIFKVCPDGLVYEVGQLSLEGLIDEALAGCDVAADGAFPYMNAYTGDLAACGDATVRVDVTNYGNEPMTSASFDLYVDGTMEGTYPWSGSLDGGDTETIELTSVAVPAELEVEVIMTEANGEATSQEVASMVAPASDATTWWTVDISTDCWGAETTWEVKDQDGNVVESGGPYDNESTYNEQFGLPSTGCYTFHLYDSYGDGMNGTIWTGCNTDGSCQVYTAAGPIYSNDGTVQFFEEVAGANASTVGVDEVNASTNFMVYPNPVQDVANVTFSTVNAAEVTMDVYNALGQRVMTRDFGTVVAGNHVSQLDLSELGAGVYTVNLTTGADVSTQRVTIAR